MFENSMKQKNFVTKELRLSIALIILWSLLITAFFTYFAKELSSKIGHGSLLFVIIMVGYIVIVIVLTMLFSHRLIGPFQRLKMEMKLIGSGDYRRRLKIRNNDDIYIRSFVMEVNKLLDDVEKMHKYKEGLIRQVDTELIKVISDIEKNEASKEKLREAVLAFHKKLKSLAEHGVE